MTIKVTPSELFFATDFSNKIVGNIKSNSFSDNRNKPRSKKQIFDDNLKAKLSEIAICNAIGDAGITSTMDFNIYAEGICDDFDIITSTGKSIDVKSSSPRARCLMVETPKVINWVKTKTAPSYLCMVSVDNTDCTFMFGVPFTTFCKNMVSYKRGDYIPRMDGGSTGIKLKADNCIVMLDQCDTDINEMIKYLSN